MKIQNYIIIDAQMAKSIEADLYKSFYILHPIFGIEGKVSLEELNSSSKENIIVLDRNVLAKLLAAVKKGCFDGEERKPVTALLLFAMINDCYLCPYDALKEQAYFKGDNISGNKEDDLFNYLFDTIGSSPVFESYKHDGVKFESKAFKYASGMAKLNYLDDTADFLFLYASMLHFAYVLRSGNKREEQFEKYMEWYFNKALISGYALTYTILFLTSRGITPPHNINDDKKIIDGCKNQAMDLFYLQECDPRRYPSERYTMMLVTQDKVMARIFETYHKACNCCCSEIDLFGYLCSDVSENRKDNYITKLKNMYESRSRLCVNEANALEVARNLVTEEETRLKSFLGI